MSSNQIVDYLGKGPLASRPSAPPVADNALAVWLDSDTGLLSVWNGSTWVDPINTTSLANLDLSGFPKTNPGGNKGWLNGNDIDGFTLMVGP
jgi:hypothetical protein